MIKKLPFHIFIKEFLEILLFDATNKNYFNYIVGGKK